MNLVGLNIIRLILCIKLMDRNVAMGTLKYLPPQKKSRTISFLEKKGFGCQDLGKPYNKEKYLVQLTLKHIW